MPKRTKSIKIRLTEKEHEDLLSRSGQMPLAEWLRKLGLDQEIVNIPKRRTTFPKVDPVLTRQLSGIGNNLNQIARIVNQVKHGIDKIWLISALSSIKASLEEIKGDNKSDS